MNLLILIASSFLIASCNMNSNRTNSDGSLPITDQLSYFNQLKVWRPSLVARDCKNNLIIKPKYRDAILNGSTEYSSIVASQYSADLKRIDALWADSFRQSAEILKAQIGKVDENTDFYVANYPPDRFVGYHVGHVTGYDSEGLGRKIYLEFKSMVEDLTPDDYLAFSRVLHRAGFNGDSKVQLSPGAARYQFNNIVIHAGSLKDVKVAERISKQFFSSKLASMGCGLDVKRGERGLDWNRFLCSQTPNALPPSAFMYLSFKD